MPFTGWVGTSVGFGQGHCATFGWTVPSTCRRWGRFDCVHPHGNFRPCDFGLRLFRPLTFMAKEELFRFPPIAALLRALGAFPVRRGAPDRRALRWALHLLRSGRCVVIFPEGTRNPTPILRPPELGVAMLAAWSQSPVVPVAIIGSERLMPKGCYVPRPTPLRVRVGKPLRFAGDGRRDALEDFAWQVMGVLAELSGRTLPTRTKTPFIIPPKG